MTLKPTFNNSKLNVQLAVNSSKHNQITACVFFLPNNSGAYRSALDRWLEFYSSLRLVFLLLLPHCLCLPFPIEGQRDLLLMHIRTGITHLFRTCQWLPTSFKLKPKLQASALLSNSSPSDSLHTRLTSRPSFATLSVLFACNTFTLDLQMAFFLLQVSNVTLLRVTTFTTTHIYTDHSSFYTPFPCFIFPPSNDTLYNITAVHQIVSSLMAYFFISNVQTVPGTQQKMDMQ